MALRRQRQEQSESSARIRISISRRPAKMIISFVWLYVLISAEKPGLA